MYLGRIARKAAVGGRRQCSLLDEGWGGCGGWLDGLTRCSNCHAPPAGRCWAVHRTCIGAFASATLTAASQLVSPLALPFASPAQRSRPAPAAPARPHAKRSPRSFHTAEEMPALAAGALLKPRAPQIAADRHLQLAAWSPAPAAAPPRQRAGLRRPRMRPMAAMATMSGRGGGWGSDCSSGGRERPPLRRPLPPTCSSPTSPACCPRLPCCSCCGGGAAPGRPCHPHWPPHGRRAGALLGGGAAGGRGSGARPGPPCPAQRWSGPERCVGSAAGAAGPRQPPAVCGVGGGGPAVGEGCAAARHCLHRLRPQPRWVCGCSADLAAQLSCGCWVLWLCWVQGAVLGAACSVALGMLGTCCCCRCRCHEALLPLLLPTSLAWHLGVAALHVHRLERALLLPTPCRRRLPAGQPPDAAGDLRRRQDVGAAHRAGSAGAKRGSACVFFRSLSDVPVLLALHGAVRTWEPRTVQAAQLHSRFWLVLSRLPRAKG